MQNAKRLLLLALILLLALPIAPVTAQEGGGELSAEQQDMINRISDALEALEGYDSFTMTITEDYEFVMVNMLDATTTTNVAASVIMGETPSVHATVDVSDYAAMEMLGQKFVDAYDMTAEIRVVEGEIYVTATREVTQGEGSEDPMPEGWVVFTSVGDFGALSALELELLGEDLFDWLMPAYLDDLPKNLAESSVEAGELADGTPVDVIHLVLEATGTNEGAGYVFLSDLTVKLDADGNLREYTLDDMLAQTDANDFSKISSRIHTQTTVLINDINAELEPVAVPEM